MPADGKEPGHGLHMRKSLPAFEEVLLLIVREVWVLPDQVFP